MGKHTNGPDWNDIGTYAKSISDTSESFVCLLLDFDGSNVVPRWRITAFTQPKSPYVLAEGNGYGASALWPHREHLTMEGAVFNLLATLDSMIARDRFLDITRARD